MNYMAYGTEIECDADLGAQLLATRKGEVRLALQAGSVARLGEMHLSTEVGAIHGRTALARSDRPVETVGPGQGWCIEVHDVVSFGWRVGEASMRYEIGPEGNEQRLGFWFAHIVLPFYLTLERRYDFLHAGAVEVDGNAIVLVAPSMGGKSTLTDYFLRHGHALITDDKLAIDHQGETYLAVPSHACHRPYRRHEDLGVPAERFAEAPRPIAAILVLDLVGARSEPVVSAVMGAAKFERVAPCQLYAFRQREPARLEFLSGLLSATPVFRVAIPRERERLSEVYDAIRCRV